MNYESHKVINNLRSYLSELKLTGVQVSYIMSAASLAHVNGRLEAMEASRERRQHSRAVTSSFKCISLSRR